MSRHVDETGEWFDRPGWDFNREILPERAQLWSKDPWLAEPQLLRDLELGFRASQWLDVIEDEAHITYLSNQAHYKCHFCGKVDLLGGHVEDWEEWDAYLCRECSAEQRKLLEQASELTLQDIFPGLEL